MTVIAHGAFGVPHQPHLPPLAHPLLLLMLPAVLQRKRLDCSHSLRSPPFNINSCRLTLRRLILLLVSVITYRGYRLRSNRIRTQRRRYNNCPVQPAVPLPHPLRLPSCLSCPRHHQVTLTWSTA